MPRTGVTTCALALAAVAAVACSDETRLIVAVDAAGAPRVDEVRLYLSTNGGFEKVLSPARLDNSIDAPELKGLVHLIDNPRAEDRVGIESRGVVSFAFVPGDLESDRMTALAVGFSDGVAVAYGMAFDMRLVADEVRIYDVDMYPANLDNEGENNLKRYLQVWGPEDGDDACVVAQLDEDFSLFMIADQGDIDCDGWANQDPLECEQYIHLSRGTVSRLEDLHGPTISDPDTGTCRVPTSVTTCSDGVTSTGPTDPSGASYCTSADVCSQCPGHPFFCPQTLERIDCIVSYLDDDPGHSICPVRLAVFPLALDIPHTCNGEARFYDDTAVDPTWSTSRSLIDDGTSLALAELFTQDCSVELLVSGTAGQSVGSDSPVAVAVPMNAPNSAGVVLPVSIYYVPVEDCANAASSCTIDDSAYDILQPVLRRCLDVTDL